MPNNLVTPNLGLVFPDPTDYTAPFDWHEFLNENFKRLDNMKMVGGMGIFNASQYIDNSTLRFRWEDIISEAEANGWLSQGIVVFFPPGRYMLADSDNTTANIELGQIKTTDSLTLIGTKGSVISSSGNGNFITDMISLSGIDNVVVSGLTLEGNASKSVDCANVGIRVFDGENILVTDCTFRNLKSGVMIQDNVSSRFCSHVWIKNNRIIDYFTQAIRCDRGKNIFIDSNYIEIGTALQKPTDTTGANAIEFQPGSHTEASTCFITNNIIIRPRRNGIQLLAGTATPSRIVVDNNTIDLAGYHVNNAVETNKATRGSGVYSTITSNIDITNNFIRDALSVGIFVQDSTAAKIVGNTVRMMDSRGVGYESLYGVDIRNCDNANISNNNIYNGYTTGVATPAWAGGSIKFRAIYIYGSDSIVCKNNIINNWFIEAVNCALAVIDDNVINSFDSAGNEYLITMINTTIADADKIVPDVYLGVGQMSLVASTASTNQASVIIENNKPLLSMNKYNSTASVYSLCSVETTIPKRKDGSGVVVRVPISSKEVAAFSPVIEIEYDAFVIDPTVARSVTGGAQTATASISATPVSFYPNNLRFDIPANKLPSDSSILRITLTRKDTEISACGIYGVHISDSLSEVNK